MELKFHKKFSKFFHGTRVHGKLEFLISGKSQHISKTVVDCKIFSKTVIFDHFSLPNEKEIGTKKPFFFLRVKKKDK